MSDDPIATRVLHLQGDETKTFKVEIFLPKKTADGTYLCRLNIEGAPEGLNTLEVGGVDSYAALISAVQAIPHMIDVYNKQFMNSKLRWFPDSEDLHFHLNLIEPKKS